MASGLPVAAFPVTGPLDVVGDSGAGALDEDLRDACLARAGNSRAKRRGRIRCKFTWRESARQFIGHIARRRAAATLDRQPNSLSFLSTSSASSSPERRQSALEAVRRGRQRRQGQNGLSGRHARALCVTEKSGQFMDPLRRAHRLPAGLGLRRLGLRRPPFQPLDRSQVRSRECLQRGKRR